MSTKRVQPYGLMVVVDPAISSDEESTEAVMKRKPRIHTPVFHPMEDSEYWMLNQDFAVESHMDIDEPAPKMTTTATESEYEIWEEDAPVSKKSDAAMEQDYGDYGVWWEETPAPCFVAAAPAPETHLPAEEEVSNDFSIWGEDAPAKKSIPAKVQEYGDYGVWWE